MYLMLIRGEKKQGPQGNCWSQMRGAGGGEGEDFCAESNGCAKRIVTLDWEKVEAGFFVRSIAFGDFQTKGGNPDLLRFTSHIWFSPK